ncbi:hypothetical protein ACSDR0_45755 [Streptosporangium sp. G11]
MSSGSVLTREVTCGAAGRKKPRSRVSALLQAPAATTTAPQVMGGVHEWL